MNIILPKYKLRGRYFPRTFLDLSGARKRPSRVSLIVLLVITTLLLTAIADKMNTSIRLAKITGQGDSNSDDTIRQAPLTLSKDEIQAVQTGINQLAIPWGSLFSAMEAVATDDIVLISLEPDATKGRVRIIAEAPDVYQMLDYIKTLTKQPFIYNVSLTSQKMSENSQEPSVRFILDAYWARY